MRRIDMVAQFGQLAASVLNHFAAPAPAGVSAEFKVLDHTIKSEQANDFEQQLSARVVGQDRALQALAQLLFGNPNGFVRVDCAEFQHPHEISKLIGAPPGYLGHRETPPLLSQENLDSYQTDRSKLTLVLFDEIEKASDALWQLLLGVLDKA